MTDPIPQITVSGKHTRQALLIIMALAVIVYLRGLWGGFVWDDRLFFIENDILTSWRPWDLARMLLNPSTYWDDHIPATSFLFVVEYNIFGLWPPGYHAVSLVIYLFTGFMVFRLVRLLYQIVQQGDRFLRTGRGAWEPRVSAALATGFFMLHPAHVEVVSYITGQKDLLYGLFSILCIYMLALYSRDGGGRGKLVLAAVFYYLAFMSKYMAVATGIFIPVLWFMVLRKRGQAMASGLGRPAAFFAILNLPAILWLLYSISGLESVGRNIAMMGGRFLLGVKVLGAHLSVFLLPWPLNFGYPFNDTNAFDPNMFMGFLFLAALAAVLVKRPRSMAALGVLMFLVFLLPILQVFVRIGNAMVFDRYLYLSVLGGALVFERAAAWFSQRCRSVFVLTVISGVLALYGFLVFIYVPTFRSDVTTLRHAYDHFPQWKRPVFDYVYALIEDGQLDEARRITLTDPALERPAWVRPYFQGWIMLEEGKLQEAIAYLEYASYDARSGRYKLYADLPLCRAYLLRGDHTKARDACKRVLAQRTQIPVEYFHARSIVLGLKGAAPSR